MSVMHTDVVSAMDRATLPALFEARVSESADRVAVTAGEHSITYRELDELSNRWARRLIATGAAPGHRIAVAVPRETTLVALAVAVMKTGATYVPLDVTHPRERLVRLLEDAEPDLLISDGAHVYLSRDGADAIPYVLVEEDLTTWSSASITAADRRGPVRKEDVAYVIYTSGSTGTPKGVAVAHRSVAALFQRSEPLFEFNRTDVWTMFHSCAFDFAVWEMWGALLHGGRVVVVDHLTSRDPKRFRALVASEGVTVLNLTPSAFYQFMEADRIVSAVDGESPLTLRYVILGGEALRFERLAPWFSRYGDERPSVTNMYGITETTVHTTFQRLTSDLAESSTPSLIGQPLPGVRLHVLDDRLRPVAPGTEGEVYVAGDQVAYGYLNRCALTATRFVPDPSSPGGVMYRSGDIARWDEEERLVYLGRADSQVQLRGFRIELEEVEAALLARDPVVDAAATVRTDGRFGDRLVGYIVTRESKGVEPSAIRNELGAQVPSYMVPDEIVVVDRIPLTVNGKLDRAALPESICMSTKPYRAPRTETERQVSMVFAEVLRMDQIGIDDGFFALGGNSLSAAAAVAMLREALGQDVDLRWVMATPTPAGLASRIDAAASEAFHSETTTSGLEVLFPLRAGEGPGVFFVHPLIGLAWSYIGLALALEFPGPIVGLQTPALTASGPLPQSIEEVAARYVSEIKAIQPEGPYHLVGWSLGGVIAHRMATIMQETGDEVASLALMDALLDSKLEGFYSALVDTFALMGVELTQEEAVHGLKPENAKKISELVSVNVGEISSEQVRRVFSMAVGSPAHVANYSPKIFRGDLLFLAAEKEREDAGGIIDDWQRVVDGSVVCRMIPCTHNDMVSDEAVAAIAPILDDWLRNVR